MTTRPGVMSLPRVSTIFFFLLMVSGSSLSPLPDAEPEAYSPIVPREYEPDCLSLATEN